MSKRISPFAGRLLVALTLIALAVPASAQRARNVILLVGDGMGPAQVALGAYYRREVEKQPLQMLEVAAQGRLGLCFTTPHGALVTDSAAAATALATGTKTRNGAISQDPEGRSLPTILEMARGRGLRTGLVATSTITHATPACFAAHVPNRATEADIAVQMLECAPDVLLGGGMDHFAPKDAGGRREDGKDLVAAARAKGYALAKTREDLAAAQGERLLGLFSGSYLSPAADRAREAPAQPSLVEMTRKALDILSRGPNGFFLMVEGSQIDTRCHANDAAGALHEVLAFDEAVGAAFAFAREHPDTLVLVTADHETGGMTFAPSAAQLGALAKASVSLSGGAFTDGMASAQILATAREKLGVELKEGDVREVLGDAGAYQRKAHAVPLARLVGGRYGVTWGTTGHSAVPVYLIAFGPGSEGVRGVQENTAVFTLMRQALGLP